MTLPNKKLQYDIPFDIATAMSRDTKLWTNKKAKVSQMVKRIYEPVVSEFTIEEYLSFSPDKQADIKDNGGYVGGLLRDGRRRKNDVIHRQVIALDADFVKDINLLINTLELMGFCCSYYTTHKHTPENPRLRILIYLEYAVGPEEYEAIIRLVAHDLGIEQFDHTTFQPERFMYWPSKAKNGEYLKDHFDCPPLNPAVYLNRYDDWTDMTKWPQLPSENKLLRERGQKKGNPLDKDGVIGMFNKTYDIPDAIDKFLPHIYERVTENRYTYVEGTTSGGLILNSHDEKGGPLVHAYSYHSTDPISDGHSHSAFDLVRIHLFREQDKEAKSDTPINRLPSFQSMVQLTLDDDEVKLTMAKEQFGIVSDEETKHEVKDLDWTKQLEYDKRGMLRDTFNNYLLILQNYEEIKDRLATDDFAHRYVVLDDLPWRTVGQDRFWKNSDDAEFRGFIETKFKTVSRNKTSDALDAVFARNRFHPVREYLNNLSWDGVPRVDKLLIDYLGADDTAFNRAVSRKTMCAAAARIMRPGIKFDYMLVLIGQQGIGKSSLFSRLAGKWFSDSLTTVQSKEAYEQLQGVWIIEMGELAATRKADVESLKHFLSKQTDAFRVAYGKHVTDFPRQCIFVGTTNDREFLKDRTGNRRFWPVEVTGYGAKNIWDDLDQHEIDQLWAESLHLWQNGEDLYLNRELEAEARRIQEEHTEESPLYGMIQEFLERKITEDWHEKDMFERRNFYTDNLSPEGTVERDKVCSMEIWVEMMGNDSRRFPTFERREINEIMRRMPGWKMANTLRFGPNYGRQRGFIRVKSVNRDC